MQNSQSPRPGDLVAVRGSRWRVVDVRAYDGCTLVTLQGAVRPYAGERRRVVTPFDVIEPLDRVRRSRFVGARPWRRACRAALAADVPAGGLVAAAPAAVAPLPDPPERALAGLPRR